MKAKWYAKIWHTGLNGEATEHGPFSTFDEALDFVEAGEEKFDVYQRD